MPTPPTAPRQLYYGDNLDVLRRKIATATVDLCYIDPPFNSKRNYFQIYTNQGAEDRAQAQAFTDTWEWGDEARDGLAHILDIERLQATVAGATTWTVQTVELIRGLHKVLGEGALLAYLVHMTLRIVEIHRVLKPTGSFYLHCDPTASHYLKLVCDAVFCGQGGDFVNEISWRRTTAKSDHAQGATHFPRVRDVIFRYAKRSDTKLYHQQFAEYSEAYVSSKYSSVDESGRRFRLDNLTGPGGASKGNAYYEVMGVTKHWRYSKANMERLISEGRIVQTKPGGVPQYKRYLDEMPGVAISDDWDDIRPINSQAQERLGYPTQKPEALLERIIRASSNEGDVVLDAYCGCGTTVAVAQRLNRRWIGIDITYQSIALILKRLEDRHPADWPAIEADLLLDGVPRDLASAVALANRKDDKTRKEFEKWAVLTYSANQARINDRKGADGGIDGTAFFFLDRETSGKVVFQVKSGKTGRGDLAKLNSDRQREKAEIGILIAMDLPTKPMEEEIRAAGKFKHPLLNREDDRLQVVTVAEIMAPFNRRLDLPWARDAVKSTAAQPDTARQATLL